MKLILVSSSSRSKEEPEIVTQLFENGLEIFHLRKHEISTRYIEEYIQQIPRKYWNQIVLHNRYQLCIKYKLKGIHLTKNKRNEKFKNKFRLWYYKWKHPSITISTSFHNLANLFEDEGEYEYVFLSPIFDSISKSGFQSAFSSHNLKMALNKSKYKIMAFGGVDITKLEIIKTMNFSGFVLSGAIWESEDKLQTFKDIKSKMAELDLSDQKISA
jgi:thiamine-phosphate pyrophosphorylase